MELPKTKAISHIEEKMEEIDQESLRYQTLQSARRFKTSWIELGQYLQTVWRDKHYRNWGYTTFESYCSKEIAIKHSTALKLLRSYYFLEREEPSFLKTRLSDSEKVVKLPSCDSVDILRLAKDKKGLHEEDYKTLRYRVLDKGEEAKEVRSELRSILESYPEAQSEGEKRKKQQVTIKRLLGTLRNLKTEIELSGILSKKLAREIDQLIAKIGSEL
jgi:vacuolar-type H+-ATPase subunit I/STV1